MVCIIFYQIDDKNGWLIYERDEMRFISSFSFYQNLFFPKSFLVSHFYHLFSTIDEKMIKNKNNHKIHHLTINHLSHLIFFLFKLVRVGLLFFQVSFDSIQPTSLSFKSIISTINYKLFDIIYLSSHILYHIFSI